jgi:hypothetical protein
LKSAYNWDIAGIEALKIGIARGTLQSFVLADEVSISLFRAKV